MTAASRLSGVPPDTLRAWERRYELVHPRRDGCGRRAYSEEDVARLRLLRLATELGHPIRHLADLDEAALRAMVERPEAQSQPDTSMVRLVERVLAAVDRYRADECDEVLGLAATLLDVDQLVDQVLAPLLEQACERHRDGDMPIVRLRLLQAAVARTAGAIISSYRRRARGPVVLLAALAPERDEMGLLLCGLLAARDGADCLHLGSEIPAGELALAAEETGARCVLLNVAGGADAGVVCRELDTLAQQLPRGCEVWLGGLRADALVSARLPRPCRVLPDTDGLRRQLQDLLAS